MDKLRKGQITITILTSLFYFTYYMGRYNYSITVPFIQKEFALSNTQIGAFATILTAGYAIGQFINGFLIDRYGPRKMMTIGGLLSTLANFGVSIGANFTQILACWGANGYVQALGYPSCCKIYSNWFPKRERGKPLGFNEGLQSLSSFVIAPLGAMIIVSMGWRFAYVIPVIPMAIGSLIFYKFARNRPQEKEITPDWERDISVPHAREAYKAALSDWRMIAAYISYGASQFGRFVIYTWVAKYIYELTGNIIMAGWVTGLFALGGSIGSFFFGWLSDIFNKRWPLITVGMLLSTFALIIFAISPDAPIFYLSILMALCGFGIEAVETCYFLLPIDVGEEHGTEATGVGVMNAFGKLFATFQGVTFGLLLDLFNYQTSFLVTAFICLLAALLVIPIGK